MKKFLKLTSVFATLMFGLCLFGCKGVVNSEKDIPAELTQSNAEEVLGKNYKTKTKVEIPNGVKTIGKGIFYESSTIKSITIPESVTYISDGEVFTKCTALQSIILPSSLTYLGSCAFYGCTALESVTIPEGIPSISTQVFDGCISLKSIRFPASIVSISGYMCSGCLSLSAITIPEGIKEIGISAFENCKALRSITLPSTISKINNKAFMDCTALGSVTVKAEIPPELYGGLTESTFSNNQTGRKIYVPSNSVEAYKTANGWKDYADSIEAM